MCVRYSLGICCPATCFIEMRPMPALWQASRAAIQRGVLVEPGGPLDHDRVDEPPLGRRLQVFGALGVVAREADEAGLARLLDGLDRVLEFLALGPFQRSFAVLAGADPVDEQQVDVVGLERLQPLVELGDELAVALPRVVLGDEEDVLAHGGVGRQPLGDGGLGAVAVGGVEGADALLIREAQELRGAGALPGAEVEHGQVDAGLAERASGERRLRRGGSGGLAPVRQGHGGGTGDRAGPDEISAVQRRRFVAHHGPFLRWSTALRVVHEIPG